MAMKSNSPVTEYASLTPSIAASRSPAVARARRSTVMRTIAVITLQRLDVDVVQRAGDEVRGVLIRARFAAVQRGLVRVERVGLRLPIGLLLQCGELLLDLDDAIARGAADHERTSLAGTVRY